MAEVDGADSSLRGLQPAEMTLTRYEVQIEGLADFAAFMERELGTNLRPAVDGILQDAHHGSAWGRHIRSGAIQQARQEYWDAHVVSMQNLTAFITVSEIMIETIRRLTVKYQTSEEIAAVGFLEVNAIVASVNEEFLARNPKAKERHDASTPDEAAS